MDLHIALTLLESHGLNPAVATQATDPLVEKLISGLCDRLPFRAAIAKLFAVDAVVDAHGLSSVEGGGW
jgi:hypothetical protein